MAAPSEGQPPVTSPPVQVVLSPSNVWRVGFAVAAMVVLVYFLNFAVSYTHLTLPTTERV